MSGQTNVCGSRMTICDVSDEADASLIAAAPELLYAAKQALGLMILELPDGNNPVIESLRNAINKAEGIR